MQKIKTNYEANCIDNEFDLPNYDRLFIITENFYLIGHMLNNMPKRGNKSSKYGRVRIFCEIEKQLTAICFQFASDLNITKEDLESMTGVKIYDIEEYEKALVGLMLFVTTADCSIIDDESQNRGGSFKDCFLEATGIAAGAAIIGGLSKGTVSKAVVRSTLKMVAKLGTRTLCGAGLALLAAEIAWCMW